MSLTWILAIAAVIGILAGCYVFFVLYPKSAVAVARNSIFELRSELFQLAVDRGVRFDNRGYLFARLMLNGMLRFADEVTLSNILVSKAVANSSRRVMRKAFEQHSKACMRELPHEVRVDVEKILTHASDAIFQLMVTRSVGLSLFLGVVIVNFAVLEASRAVVQFAKRAVKAGSSALSASKERNSAREGVLSPAVLHRSRVEEAIEELLDHKPMINVRPSIKLEVSRYLSREGRSLSDGLELCAA